jgi:hypothetical protein
MPKPEPAPLQVRTTPHGIEVDGLYYDAEFFRWFSDPKRHGEFFRIVRDARGRVVVEQVFYSPEIGLYAKTDFRE